MGRETGDGISSGETDISERGEDGAGEQVANLDGTLSGEPEPTKDGFLCDLGNDVTLGESLGSGNETSSTVEKLRAGGALV